MHGAAEEEGRFGFGGSESKDVLMVPCGRVGSVEIVVVEARGRLPSTFGFLNFLHAQIRLSFGGRLKGNYVLLWSQVFFLFPPRLAKGEETELPSDTSGSLAEVGPFFNGEGLAIGAKEWGPWGDFNQVGVSFFWLVVYLSFEKRMAIKIAIPHIITATADND